MTAPQVRVSACLITGLPGAERRAAIARLIAPLPADTRVSLLLEGLSADGRAEVIQTALHRVHVLAPGCLCCSGQLTLRVTLARVLRHEAPQFLVIALADPAHLKRFEAMLRLPPWDGWLQLQANVSGA